MFERFIRALDYWMFAVSHPGYVLEIAQRDLHRVRISFYIMLVFSLLFSLSSLILWRSDRVPMEEIWIPFIPHGSYFLYQASWCVPWFIGAWILSSGIVYLFTSAAGKEAYYEDSLMISALSISIPFLMFWWIPETFLLPAMGPGTGIRWPELFEFERKYLFPALWQVSLVAFGMRKLNNTNRLSCIFAGCLAALAFFLFRVPFMR